MALPLAAAAVPAVSPWAVAGASALGGLATSAFNLWQADESRDFNRDMAGSAHQREVADLRKAGLNPVLSAGGHGAAVAPSPTPQAGNFDVSSKALEAMQLRNQTGLANAQIRDLNSASTLKDIDARIRLATEQDTILNTELGLRKLMSDMDMTSDQRAKIASEIKSLEVQRNLTRAQTDYSAKQAAALDADNQKKKLIGRGYEAANKFVDKVERVVPEAVDKVKKVYKNATTERRQFKSAKDGFEWLKGR